MKVAFLVKLKLGLNYATVKVGPGTIQGLGHPKAEVHGQRVLLGTVLELLAPVLGLTCMHINNTAVIYDVMPTYHV